MLLTLRARLGTPNRRLAHLRQYVERLFPIITGTSTLHARVTNQLREQVTLFFGRASVPQGFGGSREFQHALGRDQVGGAGDARVGLVLQVDNLDSLVSSARNST